MLLARSHGLQLLVSQVVGRQRQPCIERLLFQDLQMQMGPVPAGLSLYLDG